MKRSLTLICLLVAVAALLTPVGWGARANDKLLDETVEFTGAVLFLQSHVPALVIGVVRDGQTAIFGFGERSDGLGKRPDRHTMLRIGSISKAFTGQVLASLVADGTVKFSDRLHDRIGWNVTIPSRPPAGSRRLGHSSADIARSGCLEQIAAVPCAHIAWALR
jgi:D-alanyl-D-alanine-carboxypeptidase/D-alanyl-D-alanine-endopeptidase